MLELSPLANLIQHSGGSSSDRKQRRHQQHSAQQQLSSSDNKQSNHTTIKIINITITIIHHQDVCDFQSPTQHLALPPPSRRFLVAGSRQPAVTRTSRRRGK